MIRKIALVLFFLLISSAVILGVGPSLPNGPANIAASTIIWPANTTGAPTSDLSVTLPAQAPKQYLFATTGSSGYYYVGATAAAGSTMSGIQSTIEVVSQSVSGCLSYWVSLDSAANIWGQVGYYLCNGATPVAFYQVWNLNTNAVLVTGTAAISMGRHTFSMFDQSGTTWAYSLDGTVYGTFNMQAVGACTCYPLYATSEEGSVSSTYNPMQVGFSNIQVMQAGVWSPLISASSYIGSLGAGTWTAWGVAGNLQNPAILPAGQVIGGSTPTIQSGTKLWLTSGPMSTTSTPSSSISSVTSTSTSTSSIPAGTTTGSSTSVSTKPTTTTSASSTFATSTVSSTPYSSTSSSQTQGLLQTTLIISPTLTNQKSTVYVTVTVTDQNRHPVPGANVSVTVTSAGGKSSVVTGSTNVNGQAFFQYKVNPVASLGLYSVSTITTHAGFVSVKASGSFAVI